MTPLFLIKKNHLEKWASDINCSDAFSSAIDEHIVSDIMALNGVDNLWKVLLMMGIGVFINHENIKYTEIMKKLADEQKLYMIIATSDYIYGTNYQFFIGFFIVYKILFYCKLKSGAGSLILI